MVDFERGDTCRRRSAERACRRRPWSVQPHWAALGTRGARRVSAGQQYSRTPYNRTAVQPYSRAVQPYVVQPYSRTAHSPAEPRRAPRAACTADRAPSEPAAVRRPSANLRSVLSWSARFAKIHPWSVGPHSLLGRDDGASVVAGRRGSSGLCCGGWRGRRCGVRVFVHVGARAGVGGNAVVVFGGSFVFLVLPVRL